MDAPTFRYAIEYLTPDGERLGSHAFEPDWGPAQEYAYLQEIRCAESADSVAYDPSACRVEPIWDESRGEPFVGAARISRSGAHARGDGDDTVVCAELPALPYFMAAAREGSAAMIASGLLQAGDRYLYRVCAYTCRERVATPLPGPALSLEESSDPLKLDEAPLESFLAAATHALPGADDELCVFIPAAVLEHCHEHSRSAATVETGGILVGNLHRSAAEPRLFLEITAMIPAPHTDAGAASLTFTPETWKAVANATALRGREELMCGWFHFHPHFCRACPAAARSACRFSRAVFSSEDAHMHRTVFPRAFQVALLVSDLGDAYDTSFFGWSGGRVAPRGYHVLGLLQDRSANP